jgi:hypothetical protein
MSAVPFDGASRERERLFQRLNEMASGAQKLK